MPVKPMTADGSAPENTGKKQANTGKTGQFKKGQSGNRKGRPKGSRNWATLAAEALLDGEAEALSKKAVELALDGDKAALRLCLERIIPARRSRPVTFNLPETATAEDIVTAHDSLLSAVANGEITPEDAEIIAGLLEAKRKAIEMVELAQEFEAMKAEVDKINQYLERKK